jgi:hypothetical protein
MAASDDLKTLDELIKNPSIRAGGTARYKNKSYTLAQLVAERDKIAKQVKEQGTSEARTKQAAQQLTKEERVAQEEIDRPIRRARGELEAALGNLNIAIDRNGDIAAAQRVVGEAYRALQSVNPQDKMLEGIVVPGVSRGAQEREGRTSDIGIADPTLADRATEESIKKRTDAEAATGITSVKTIVENGVQMQLTTYANGDEKKTPLVSSAAAGTAGVTVSAGVTPAATKPGKGPKVTAQVVAPSTDWEATFRSTFPSKAWLLDQDRSKYPQLFALLQKAHDEKYYESTEGQARFAAELQGVDFYRELASSGKVREIKTIVGDLGFDSTDFSKFVTDSINFGWTGETLKAETYKEVFRKNPDGTYANPTSIKRATAGNDYLGVQLIAKNYFNSAPQSSIESVLTGGITTADFQRQQREIAKQRYGHLADLIDQGVTLEDLAGNYKQTAAKLLEVDPNTIDMSQGDYEVALSFGDEGKKRAMTTGEWEKLLRTDSRYGWEKTENAKTEARSLANNLAQAFGRII